MCCYCLWSWLCKPLILLTLASFLWLKFGVGVGPGVAAQALPLSLPLLPPRPVTLPLPPLLPPSPVTLPLLEDEEDNEDKETMTSAAYSLWRQSSLFSKKGMLGVGARVEAQYLIPSGCDEASLTVNAISNGSFSFQFVGAKLVAELSRLEPMKRLQERLFRDKALHPGDYILKIVSNDQQPIRLTFSSEFTCHTATRFIVVGFYVLALVVIVVAFLSFPDM